MAINWADAANDPKYQTKANQLKFYKADGQLAGKAEDGVTKDIEYVTADEEKEPQFPDAKGRTMIKFTFLDLEDKTEKYMFKPAGGRFFKQMVLIRPEPGTKLRIQRTGTGYQTDFIITKA